MTPNEKRLDHLARTCGPRVLTYLARRATPAGDAADVYQQVLVTTWTKIARVPGDEEAALCWMLAVARRHLANHSRGRLRRLESTARLAESLRTGPGQAPAEADHGSNRVLKALQALSDDDRELVQLVYWDDLSTEQAATVLNIRPATARKRLERCRTQLKATLETPGPAPSEPLEPTTRVADDHAPATAH
ncbi:sigma-70 family RNA polymerase sigma factor [Terrabacter sp. NPDC080008]|uniref:RNA polymerase sigma factor n=1 Tax=Terrabacter sp. NPDC080008 TaxID=3155176 RepID=UPI00344C2266